MSRILDRRGFIAGAATAGLAAGAALIVPGCREETPPTNNNGSSNSVNSGNSGNPGNDLPPLPPVSPNLVSEFEEDLNVNISTIDQYLNRSDVVYRDLRMFMDFNSTEPRLEDVLEGFKIVSYPLLASLPDMSFSGDYRGEKLISLEFGEKATILSSSFDYVESETVINDLFPKDKPILLVCGGGGYAWMMKKLLIHLGWDESKLYVVGGMRAYRGFRTTMLTIHATQIGEPNLYATWRADYATIAFNMLHKNK